MVRKTISQSCKIASLSPKSLALFGMLIPHFNAHGKMNGNPYFIKGEVVPKIKWFTIPVIQKALREISNKTNVKWFEHQGCQFIHSLSFDEHQEIREDRLGADHLPSYSGSPPGVIPLEVEVEVEGEVQHTYGEGIQKSPKPYIIKTPLQEVVCYFKTKMGVELEDREWDDNYFARYSAPAKKLLHLFKNDSDPVERSFNCIDGVIKWLEGRNLSWMPETVEKHASNWKTGRLGK